MNDNEKINILLVDDRPENLLALEVIIEREEYNLIKASSGEEALTYLLKYDFAVVLLDVQMPGLDGFSTAKIIQARERTKHIPIIFITANHLSTEHIFTGYSVGAVDYLLKPFDPFVLKSKVERFVAMYQLNRSLARQNQMLEEQRRMIEYLAYHDSLTELPNRRQFNSFLSEQLNDCKQHKLPLALICLDMDRFKLVNDSLGEAFGDRLLKMIAERLESCLEPGEFIARIDGNEFAIILPGANRDNALQAAECVLSSFRQPFKLEQYEIVVTASIGISIFPYDGEDAQTLINSCDSALYRAKEKGKNNVKLYHSGMNLQTFKSFILQQDLRKAVERNELYLVYQPRIHLDTGQITSAEALIRWRHPTWGTIMPGEFIPLAEETGSIVEIGIWVLREACRQLQAWKQAGFAPVRIAVNFSAQQFMQQDLLGSIKQAMNDFEIQASEVEIEITESLLLEADDHVTSAIQTLRKSGVTVSLDDFGTGYSSLKYLQRFPVDIVKIDKSFIQGLSSSQPESSALVSSIIAMTKALRMSVIAEGVETEEQLAELRTLQCQEVQGYYFSKPVLPEEFEVFILGTSAVEQQPLTDRTPKRAMLGEEAQQAHNEAVMRHALERTKEKYALSERETEVFSLLVEGLSNKEISEQLFISEHTVKNHITHIFQKLGISDRMQAMSKIYQTSIEVSQHLRAK